MKLGLLLLCLVQTCSAQILGGLLSLARPATSSADVCGGADGLIFSWHCENLDVTVGTPTGCSSGDTTGTAASAAVITNNVAQDGISSLHIPTSSDTVAFTVTGRDIFDARAGTIDFYFMWTNSFVAGAGVWDSSLDATHRMRAFTSAGSFLKFRFQGGADLTSTNAMNASQWYHFKYTWTTNNVNPNLALYQDGVLQAVDNVNIADFGIATTLTFGEFLGTGSDYFLDDIKIYNQVK